MADVVISGGTVVDGTGGPPRRADVAVAAGRIIAVGEWRGRAARTVDASGLVVCPGFIDIHTHSDLSLLSNPLAHSKVRQGVTTEVLGNCGLGVAPVRRSEQSRPVSDARELRSAVAFLDVDPAIAWTWQDFGGYLDALAAARASINTAVLCAHLPLHAAVAGMGDRQATPDEVARMCALLVDAFDAGAVGFSTGLVYAPLCYVAEEELLALGRTVAEHGRVFAWHVRDYADGLLASVAQALRVAERTGCRTQISHLAAVGRANWGRVAQALELVEAAQDRGVDVAVDVYPYLAGSANLSQLLPAWVHEGGSAAMVERLGQPEVRERVRADLAGRPVGWDEITVSWTAPGYGEDTVGRSIADLADGSGTSGADVVMELIVATNNAVSMVAFGRCEDDLLTALRHPASVVGSDGLALDPGGPTGSGAPHPRSYGCFPRFLANYVGPNALTLADAVAKCTMRAGERVGITDRGSVATDQAADLVVIDPERIADRATYAEPHQFPSGIVQVIVNGQLVVDGGRHTGAPAGAVVRRTYPHR